MHNNDPIIRTEIPAELHTTIGEIKEITFPRQGHTSNVGIVNSHKGRFVLKRTRGEQYSEWLKKEAFVLEGLSRTNLVIPKMYQFIQHEDVESGTQAWLFMQFLQGETIRKALTYENNATVRYNIIFNFGKTLRELHSTQCPVELKHEETWIDSMLSQAEYNFKHYSVDGTQETLYQLKQSKPRIVEQTLIHGDFTIDNVLVHHGKISGVIDWSGGAYGDPRYDVALAIRPKPNVFQSANDHRAFFDGYGGNIISNEEFEYFEKGLYAFF
ncbi:aminoglycoside phosphotransferase family protein [Paenibacillus pasadenensis]|nr:aminoglycoside phosphotransferase family protein [Paenibacillus pasadenensis]